MAMLLLVSHLCGVRLMLSLFFIFFSLFYSLSSSFMFGIVFLLCYYLLFVFAYSFLVIQSDLEKYSKIVIKIFTASMSLSWRIMTNWAYYTMKNLADLYQKKSIPFLWGWTIYWLKNRNLKSVREQFYTEKWFWELSIH